MMQRICKTAIFNFQQSDQDLINMLADYLDSNYKKILEFFEIDIPTNKVVIDIIPTKKEFDAEYKKRRNLDENQNLPNWLIGNCHHNSIMYLSLYDFKNTKHAFDDKEFPKALEHYKKTILHEYVHFINYEFCNKHNCDLTQRFLVEGIATYLSGQKDGLHLKLTATKEKILNTQNYYYNDYYLITKYFVENYDKATVLEAFEDSNKAKELFENELYEKTEKMYGREDDEFKIM